MDDPGEILHQLRVAPPQAGARLDKWLAATVPDLSRSRLKALIEDGRVEAADGSAMRDPNRRMRAGEQVVLRVPAPEAATPAAEAIDLVIVHEDAHLIVVDKPAGMVVHPAPGNRSATLVNALLHHCGDSLSGIGGVRRPGIVHRLDKDTSGLLVAAKTDEAHRSLTTQFAGRTIERAYFALCLGVPSPPAGELAGAIGRSPANRKKMAVVERGGRPALTRYRLLRAYGGVVAWLECRLATGRTHQIRVHLAALGHPLVGDPLYGRRMARARPLDPSIAQAIVDFPRQALHAHTLGFTHPATGERLRFELQIPNDINAILELLERV